MSEAEGQDVDQKSHIEGTEGSGGRTKGNLYSQSGIQDGGLNANFAEAEKCPALAAASGATPFAQELGVKTDINVTCATGYSTADTATCNPDNTWSLPTCTGAKCRNNSFRNF